MTAKTFMLPILLLGCSSTPGGSADAGSTDAPTADVTPQPDAGSEAGVSPEQAFWTAFWAADLSGGVAAIPVGFKPTRTRCRPTSTRRFSSAWTRLGSSQRQAATPRRRSRSGRRTVRWRASTCKRPTASIRPTPSPPPSPASPCGTPACRRTTRCGSRRARPSSTRRTSWRSPSSGWFVELILAQNLPVNDPQMTTAITDGWNYFSICGGTTLDPSAPDFTAYMAQTKTSTRTFCVNDMLAPHVVEGGLLYFGDLLVKSGERQRGEGCLCRGAVVERLRDVAAPRRGRRPRLGRAPRRSRLRSIRETRAHGPRSPRHRTCAARATTRASRGRPAPSSS